MSEGFHKDKDPYDKPGEWKEYHTNDIAEIKQNYFFSGWMTGALLSGIAFAYYFMR